MTNEFRVCSFASRLGYWWNSWIWLRVRLRGLMTAALNGADCYRVSTAGHCADSLAGRFGMYTRRQQTQRR